MMNYMSAQDASEKWGITKRRVQYLCASNRIANATRVGNMWIIPSDAQKPYDSRFKNKTEINSSQCKNPLKAARNRIKFITTHGINKLLENNNSYEDSKKILVSVFSYGLLCGYAKENQVGRVLSKEEKNDIKESIYAATKIHLSDIEPIDEIYNYVQQYVEDFPFCCDDALSWCYQFANKTNPNSNYSNTQFFTEKYMITTIVDTMNIIARKKILDPACGGGNFLLYSIDLFCEKTEFPNDNKLKCIEIIQSILDRHYGYEIDSTLATVASINLRIKCVSILVSIGYHVSSKDFECFTPNIYSPVDKTIGGALDARVNKQIISKIGTKEKINIDCVFCDIDAIITNPPFQTIKGMDIELKQYLKENYPLSKCDMCNAFIELSKNILSDDGIAGMVTQNSWMYLDSFIEFRKTLLLTCSFDKIWELGSNAFFDLNGEKSNVALVIFRNIKPNNTQKILLSSLKSLNTESLEGILLTTENDIEYTKLIPQIDVLNNFESRFDMISTVKLRELLSSSKRYKDFAVPMQGTSTGNAKKLIGYFWEHLGDQDWKLVSKGGGYSRWQGLNHYCVKWGNNGEYIKAQKGSAIRNANYFNQTQMVFSDTGTSGLNVRELQQDQIFVASGPGIRIKQGKPYAHLAFLNSRFVSYYIRLISPKLTIAAGYISKIPICEGLLNSEELENAAINCVKAKKRRLSRRPFNIEFIYCNFLENISVEEQAYQWFLADIQDEWEQLKQEEFIDQYVYSTMGLTDKDISTIDNHIGKKYVFSENNDEQISYEDSSTTLIKSIDCNCNITRTKVERNHLGCDGLLEYLSQKTGVSCESIYKYILETNFYPKELKLRYENLLIHAVLMSNLDYLNAKQNTTVLNLIKRINKAKDFNIAEFRKWIIENFNFVHSESFCKKPLFIYNPTSDEIEIIKEKENG